MDRELIDYIPPQLKGFRELKASMYTEQPEIESIWGAGGIVLQNRFILDMTEYGVKRWEKILEIFPKASESLDARKTRILIRLNERLPYTKRRLSQMLAAICGEGNSGFEVNHDLHILSAYIKPERDLLYTDVFSLLDRVVPADLIISLTAKKELQGTASVFPHTSGLTRLTTLPDADLQTQTSLAATVGAQLLPYISVYRRTVLGEPEMLYEELHASVTGSAAITGVYKRYDLREGFNELAD